MNGLLLCAGLGSRFAPHTEILPKPAIPLLNVPLAFYNLHLIQQLGLDALAVNTHHLPQQVVNLFSASSAINLPVSFSHEKAQILGSGGGIKQARPFIQGKGTFVVSNADGVCGISLRDALAYHHRQQPMATLIAINHPQAGKKYGALWVNGQGEVVSVGKDKPEGIETKPMHFVGIQLIEESIFKYLPEGPGEVWPAYKAAQKEGEKVLVYEEKGYWYDAGNLRDFLRATEDLLNMLPKLQHQPFLLTLFRRFWKQFDKRPSVWEGINCKHSLQLNNDARILLDDNVQIHPSVKIQGYCVVGANSIIEEGVTLENTVIARNQHVTSGRKLKNKLVL